MQILDYKRRIKCYAGQNKPKFIVIHETDNTAKGAGAKKHGEAHKNGNLSTSVHYYVDDTYVVQTLDHKDGSYSVGTKYGTPLVAGVTNRNTINIEICVNPESNYEKARLKCVELVKYLMKQTGIPADRVIRHYDAKRKHCPRKMLDNPKLWDDFKKRIRSNAPSAGVAPSGGGEKDVKIMVTYFGDADLPAAVIVAQKNKAPLMRVSDFKEQGIKADKVIQIGGKAEDKNRFETFKNAAKLL